MSNEKGALSIEEQGIDIISEEERKGTPASLFWPWFAANISMFAMSYGAWALGFWHLVLAGHRHDRHRRGHVVPAGRCRLHRRQAGQRAYHGAHPRHLRR